MDVELATHRPDSISGFLYVKNTMSCDPITQDYKNYSESYVNLDQPRLIESQATGGPDEEVCREMTTGCIESASLNVESEPTGLRDHPANKPADDEVIISPAGFPEDLPVKSNFENHALEIQIRSLDDDAFLGTHNSQADVLPDKVIRKAPSIPIESLSAINYSPRKGWPSSRENKALFHALAQQNSNIGHTDQRGHLPCSIAEATYAFNLQTSIVGEFLELEDPVSRPRQEITLNSGIIMTEEHPPEDIENPSNPVRNHVGKATHVVTSRIGTEAQHKTTNSEHLTINAQGISSDSQRLRKRPTVDDLDPESGELGQSSTPGQNTIEAASRLTEHHPPHVPETDKHDFESIDCASTIPSESTRTITRNTSNPLVRQSSPATPKGDDGRRSSALVPQEPPGTPSIPNKEVLAAELKAMRIVLSPYIHMPRFALTLTSIGVYYSTQHCPRS